MTRNFIIMAAVFGFLGVGAGAFGTHALRATLEASGRYDTYQTAVQYHLLHALALLGAAWVAERYPGRWSTLAGWLLTAGILLFSGSLYTLAIGNLSFMGAVAPLGGVCLLLGWLALGIAAWRAQA
ncbi:MAG: DUF423 domain-containing protein [Anaerolineae bacterium]|nr:DUF423 domain-containing protein [Anaerolineae bacterium]